MSAIGHFPPPETSRWPYGFPVLDVVNLDAAEQAVYELLVEVPVATITELTVALSLPVPRLWQVLERLEDLGLVSRVPGKTGWFAAAAPDVALEVLFLEQEERIKRGRMLADRLSAKFRQTVARRDPATLVEVISGRSAAAQRFEQVQRSARHQIRAIDRPPYASDPARNHPVEVEMLDRGIAYRVIYDSTGMDQFHDLLGELEISIAHGEQARVLPAAPLKLCLADDRIGMIPLQAAPPDIESAVVVHKSALLDALCTLFDALWERALPLALVDDPSVADGPTTEERRLLALLTTGIPDETIAKQLGLSQRTLQRRIRALMTRLGAETRFQAGLRAAQVGWIGPANPVTRDG
jgi:DNA-binding CsgD family transcriptional regulator